MPPYDQTLFLLGATIAIKATVRSAVLAPKLDLMISAGTATNVLRFYNNPAQSTSLSFLLPPTPFHLYSYQLNRGINSQSYNGMLMEFAWNYLNCMTDWLTQILILLPPKSLKSVKQTKLGWSKVTPPSVKNKTFLAMVFNSLSATTWSSKIYTPSNKQVWKSYPFESAHQNHYRLKCTTSTFPTPQLSRPTLIQTSSINLLIT